MGFLHRTILVYAHALANLFSSQSTFTASNSVKQLFSMTCKREKKLGSVRSSRHVLQSGFTRDFFTAPVLVYALALARLLSSPVTCTASNSVTHFVSMTCKHERNLGSVRSSRNVIQGGYTWGFFTAQYWCMHTLWRTYFPHQLHVQLQTLSLTLFQ